MRKLAWRQKEEAMRREKWRLASWVVPVSWVRTSEKRTHL